MDVRAKAIATLGIWGLLVRKALTHNSIHLYLTQSMMCMCVQPMCVHGYACAYVPTDVMYQVLLCTHVRIVLRCVLCAYMCVCVAVCTR